MEKVKQYLTEYIDERAEIRDCPEGITNSMPLVLKAAFDWYELTIMGEKVLLLKPVQKQTVYRLKNWTEQIEKSCGMNTILLMEDATPYMIKKMLSDRMAFVIPGKQISIPFLIMMIKTEKKREHKAIKNFSPSTQLIFLYILYSEWDIFTMEELEAALDISKMSAQRGLAELEELGLLSHKTGGKTGRKKVFERAARKDFYEEGRAYLDNPVRDTVYVSSMPEAIGSVTGDLSALSAQTMLGEPVQKHYALWNRYRSRLDGYLVTEEQAAEEKLPAVQLMKYDVEKLSRNHFVDPVTLILGLSEMDERIEMAVDELMDKYDWYESEVDKW